MVSRAIRETPRGSLCIGKCICIHVELCIKIQESIECKRGFSAEASLRAAFACALLSREISQQQLSAKPLLGESERIPWPPPPRPRPTASARAHKHNRTRGICNTRRECVCVSALDRYTQFFCSKSSKTHTYTHIEGKRALQERERIGRFTPARCF